MQRGPPHAVISFIQHNDDETVINFIAFHVIPRNPPPTKRKKKARKTQDERK